MPLTGEREYLKLIQDLRKMPDGVGRRLGKEFKTAAQVVAADARQRASWSTRIPGAIKVQVSRSRSRPGAQIVVPKHLPHARLYEFGADRRGFRHPVFGHMDRWVQEARRPFIVPAMRAHRDAFLAAAGKAVDAAAREAGFK